MFKVNREKCVGCQQCIDVCPMGAISIVNSKARIDGDNCRECGNCAQVCPENAIYNTLDKDVESKNNLSFDQTGNHINSFSGKGLGRGKGKGLGRGPRDGRGSGRGGGRQSK